jgi:hypothetical protein
MAATNAFEVLEAYVPQLFVQTVAYLGTVSECDPKKIGGAAGHPAIVHRFPSTLERQREKERE